MSGTAARSAEPRAACTERSSTRPERDDTFAGRILLGSGLLAWERWTLHEARVTRAGGGGVRPLGDERALNGLAVLGDQLGEFERAESLYTESLEIARRLGDPRAIATVLMAETHRFDYERAETLHADCLRPPCQYKVRPFGPGLLRRARKVHSSWRPAPESRGSRIL
jgi:hypothetical protein